MKIKTKNILITSILLLVAVVVASNYAEERAIDKTKIPEKVEYSKEFQRWINNHKKRMEITADEFRLQEKNEIFNSAYLTILSADNINVMNEYENTINEYKKLKRVRFSPSDRQFLDYRHIKRGEYLPNEIHYYGLREDKIIDTKILSCNEEKNCYFDRAFFVDNDSFAISEISRNISDNEIETGGSCDIEEICTYTFKLHYFDLKNNSRLVYESNPFEMNLSAMARFF